MNYIVSKNREQFLAFKIFLDRLSAVERKFNADDLFTLENQLELTQKTSRMIRQNHMFV